MHWRSQSPAETRALGRALAECLDDGAVVALIGALGAGKTVFVKGLAEGLGLEPARLSSPTFVIANELPLPPGQPADRLVHADFYRVEVEEELEAAGLHDWLADRTLLVVEWGDRFPEALAKDRLEVHIVAEGELARSVEGRATGPEAARRLEAWQERTAAAGLDAG